MVNATLALSAAKTLEQAADSAPKRIHSLGLGSSQHRLELGKYLLYRVVVRAVARQATYASVRLLAGPLDARDFMEAQVVSITTMSPGRSSGTRSCFTQAL